MPLYRFQFTPLSHYQLGLITVLQQNIYFYIFSQYKKLKQNIWPQIFLTLIDLASCGDACGWKPAHTDWIWHQYDI